jgi:hypothetical protein
VCGKSFVRYRNAIACSDPCRRRLKWNKSYFGGRLFDAVGWAQRECQLCGRVVAKKAHVHHVFGHPDHSALVVLCAGCHDVVSTLARRSTYQDEQFRRLRWFVAAQRDGAAPAGRDRVWLRVRLITEEPAVCESLRLAIGVRGGA